MKVGIWVRVSTDMQVERDSPERHEERAREFIAAKGWEVATVYRLDGVSGAISLQHAEGKRMLRDVETGRIRALVFSDLSRLARSLVGIGNVVERFKKAGAQLIPLDGSIDTSTPQGEFGMQVLAGSAELHRKLVAQQVRNSIPSRVKKGLPLGGTAPFGYQWVEQKLVPHPEHAPVRRLMHELFLEHRRLKTVARLLNERGYTTRSGKPWSGTSIDWLLRDPTAKGWHRLNYLRSNGPGQHWTFKEPGEATLHPVEAIVPEDLWEQAYALRQEQIARGKHPTKRVKHLFSGFVRCGPCKRNLARRKGSSKYECYGCGAKITATALEGLFLRQLRERKIARDVLAEIAEDRDDALGAKLELLDSSETQLEKLKAELRSALALYRQGALTDAAFHHATGPAQEQLAKLEKELPLLEAEIAELRRQRPSPEELFGPNPTCADAWPMLEFDGQRQLVEAFFSVVTLDAQGQASVTVLR